MKIAVCADGDTIDSRVDAEFGHCRGWLLIDTETDACQPGPNQTPADNCRGTALAMAMAASGAKAVIIDHCGPGAFAALTAAGLAVYAAPGLRVHDAVAQFKQGQLPRVEAARCGHGNRHGCCHGW